MQNHQTLPKSAEISFIIFLGHVLCVLVYFCLYVCKVYFVSLCIFVEAFVRPWLSQAFLAFWSCPQYYVVFYAFVLLYDIGIKFDMIYDMIQR